MRARNLAVMFTDMEGFTAGTRKRTRYQIASLIKEHENLIRESSSVFGGRIIKNLGDGLLIVFESGTDAVRCGVELQKDIKRRNTKVSKKDRFRIKIAIACGDVVLRNADVYGEPVNLASRLLEITPVGKVYLSQSVFLSMNKYEIVCTEVGKLKLKGFPEPATVYVAGASWSVRIFKPITYIVLVLVVVAAILMFIARQNDREISRAVDIDFITPLPSFENYNENYTDPLEMIISNITKGVEVTIDKIKEFNR